MRVRGRVDACGSGRGYPVGGPSSGAGRDVVGRHVARRVGTGAALVGDEQRVAEDEGRSAVGVGGIAAAGGARYGDARVAAVRRRDVDGATRVLAGGGVTSHPSTTAVSREPASAGGRSAPPIRAPCSSQASTRQIALLRRQPVGGGDAPASRHDRRTPPPGLGRHRAVDPKGPARHPGRRIPQLDPLRPGGPRRDAELVAGRGRTDGRGHHDRRAHDDLRRVVLVSLGRHRDRPGRVPAETGQTREHGGGSRRGGVCGWVTGDRVAWGRVGGHACAAPRPGKAAAGIASRDRPTAQEHDRRDHHRPDPPHAILPVSVSTAIGIPCVRSGRRTCERASSPQPRQHTGKRRIPSPPAHITGGADGGAGVTGDAAGLPRPRPTRLARWHLNVRGTRWFFRIDLTAGGLRPNVATRSSRTFLGREVRTLASHRRREPSDDSAAVRIGPNSTTWLRRCGGPATRVRQVGEPGDPMPYRSDRASSRPRFRRRRSVRLPARARGDRRDGHRPGTGGAGQPAEKGSPGKVGEARGDRVGAVKPRRPEVVDPPVRDARASLASEIRNGATCPRARNMSSISPGASRPCPGNPSSRRTRAAGTSRTSGRSRGSRSCR